MNSLTLNSMNMIFCQIITDTATYLNHIKCIIERDKYYVLLISMADLLRALLLPLNRFQWSDIHDGDGQNFSDLLGVLTFPKFHYTISHVPSPLPFI